MPPDAAKDEKKGFSMLNFSFARKFPLEIKMQNSKCNMFSKLKMQTAEACKFVLFIFLACILFFAGCSRKNEVPAENQSQKIKVVATIFPLYDWAKNVVLGSENADVELLIKNGVDLHSFQPSTADIVKILSADILIYVGGESDFWINDTLKNSVNKNMIQINLMEELSDSIKEEEFVDGMTEEKEIHAPELAEHTHDEVEYDEHLWLSVKNAQSAVKKITQILKEKDAAEADLIEENEIKYLEILEQLQNDGKAIRSEAGSKSKDKETIIVCDRFPFRYMTDELGIKYYAAFVGCSAETEASFETIAFLSGKIKELGATKVFVTESSDKKIARTVIKNAGLTEDKCKIVTLDSMQSTTLAQAESGKNYIDIMKKNYQKISE